MEWVQVRPDEAYPPGMYRLTYRVRAPFNPAIVGTLEKALRLSAWVAGGGGAKPKPSLADSVKSVSVIPPSKDFIGRYPSWAIVIEVEKKEAAPEDKVVMAGFEKGALALIGLVVASVIGFVVTERTIERAKKAEILDVLPNPNKAFGTVTTVAVVAGLFLIIGVISK